MNEAEMTGSEGGRYEVTGVNSYQDLPSPQEFRGEPRSAEQVQKQRIVSEVKRALPELCLRFEREVQACAENPNRELSEDFFRADKERSSEEKRTMAKIIDENVEILFAERLGLSLENQEFIQELTQKQEAKTTKDDLERLQKIGGNIPGFDRINPKGRNDRIDVILLRDKIEASFGVKLPEKTDIGLTIAREDYYGLPFLTLHYLRRSK